MKLLTILLGSCVFVTARFPNINEENISEVFRIEEGDHELILREKLMNKPDRKMDWENYHRYEKILDFVTTSALAHSDIASVEEIGKTIENRSMIVVKIGRSVQNRTKPAMCIEAGMHSNEWIAPAVTTYFINQLLNNYTNYEEMLAHVDLYILPVANPDGYEFTHTSTRLWRKNRRRNPTCFGVNLNINFEFQWEPNPDTCSEIYPGTSGFSEPETSNVRDFIEKKHNEGVNWRAYYAMHSYSQVWLLPWGWTEERPEDYADLLKFAENGVTALRDVHGTHYDISSLADFQPGTGTSHDWAKGSGIFKYAQTLELRDKGEFGFLLPPEQIIPTAEETWAAIQANAKFLMNEI